MNYAGLQFTFIGDRQRGISGRVHRVVFEPVEGKHFVACTADVYVIGGAPQALSVYVSPRDALRLAWRLAWAALATWWLG